MQLKLLAVGDVVATAGLDYLTATLPRLKREKQIDFCVVNGENTAVLGLLPRQAEEIFNAGADVITMGNHTWGKRELIPGQSPAAAARRRLGRVRNALRQHCGDRPDRPLRDGLHAG